MYTIPCLLLLCAVILKPDFRQPPKAALHTFGLLLLVFTLDLFTRHEGVKIRFTYPVFSPQSTCNQLPVSNPLDNRLTMETKQFGDLVSREDTFLDHGVRAYHAPSLMVRNGNLQHLTEEVYHTLLINVNKRAQFVKKS